MREIKFKAWNGEEMISPDYIDRNGIAFWKENSIPTKSDKVMQYTGLKDKKGNAIYEGDIVKDYDCEWKDDTDTVSFSSTGYWYPLVKVEEGYNCIDNYQPERFEVIGNIYQNPELL